MRIPSLEVPESDTELAAWLERELLGPDLSALVAELIQFGGGHNDDIPGIRRVLGGDIKRILEQGLSDVEPGCLRELLAYPALLLQLQDAIFLKGGPYWTRQLYGALVEDHEGRDSEFSALPRSSAPPRKVDPTEVTEARLGSTEVSDIPTRSKTRRPPSYWQRRGKFIAAQFAIAALLLTICTPLGIWIASLQSQVEIARVQINSQRWGWLQPNAFDPELSADQYLIHLSTLAEDWFDRTPESASELALRIGQFRSACALLILADHEQLDEQDRDWLRERCRIWSGKFQDQLNALEQPTLETEPEVDFVPIRDQADETVRTLIRLLNERAQEIRNRTIA